MGMPPKEKAPFIKSDLKHIGCDTCERLILKLRALVEDMRENAPYKKIHEDDIEDLMGRIVDPDTTEGKWATKLDLMTSKDYGMNADAIDGELYVGVFHQLEPDKFDKNKEVLVMVEKERQGRCGEECRTIAHSAELLLQDEVDDLEDLVVMLWKGVPLENLLQIVCKEMTSRCTKKRKALTKHRKDYPHIELSDEEIEYAEMMAQMGDLANMGGAGLYDQDDMMRMMEGMDPYGDYGDYGDMDFGGMDFGDLDFGDMGYEMPGEL